MFVSIFQIIADTSEAKVKSRVLAAMVVESVRYCKSNLAMISRRNCPIGKYIDHFWVTSLRQNSAEGYLRQ